MMIRINKLLALLGLSSRRGADQLIDQGRVKLNQQPASLGSQVDVDQDQVTVDGQILDLSQLQAKLATDNFEYWLLNKPAGVISAISDPQGRKAVSHFFQGKSSARLYPVGRLDYQSTGLLLMTDDGDLAYRLTHPKYKIEKEYVVLAQGIFSPKKIQRLLKGVKLAEGVAKADQIELLDKQQRQLELKFIMHEGRKREIRRMCAKVGWEVLELTRVRLANLSLGKLQPGTVRKLTETEVEALRQAVALG